VVAENAAMMELQRKSDSFGPFSDDSELAAASPGRGDSGDTLREGYQARLELGEMGEHNLCFKTHLIEKAAVDKAMTWRGSISSWWSWPAPDRGGSVMAG